MKNLLATVLLVILPVALMAKTPPLAVAKKKTKSATASRVEIRNSASQLASGIRAAESALTPDELAIAGRVYQGELPCELGAFVTLTADPQSPGYFDLQIKKQKYRMFPVITSTGAIRLEDRHAGAVWLQLSNKSMLMNQKLGQRLADVCMNPDQMMVAEMMIKNPPPSLLEALIPVVPVPMAPILAAPIPDGSIPAAPVLAAPIPVTPIPEAPIPAAMIPEAPIPAAPVLAAPIPGTPIPEAPIPTAPIPEAPISIVPE